MQRRFSVRAQTAALPRVLFGPFSSPTIRESMGLGPLIRALEDGLEENGLVDKRTILLEYPLAADAMQEALIATLEQGRN